VFELKGIFARNVEARSFRFRRIVGLVEEEARGLEGSSDRDILESARLLRFDLRREGLTDKLTARSFALVREAADRKVGMRHFDVQLIGGWVMLKGMVAEMETGEGKTLAATLTASTAALAGIPVHIVTVNDYLVSRDAEWMGPIYRALGLTVGTILEGMDPDSRRAAYGCDITYCSNKQLAFDYLKDRLVIGNCPGRLHLQLERLYADKPKSGRLIMRGLRFAIVDEVDSVLVDEARTPLIISGQGDTSEIRRIYEQALQLGEQLVEEKDFKVSQRERAVELTDGGKDRLREMARPLMSIWAATRPREELVTQALTAQHLFLLDKHYLVKDGKVQIVDEFTGRVMADRSWERGLHQMIEVKEECPITGQKETLARISYQRFFRRYLRLAGMTGTAREVEGELWSVYRLTAVRIPTNKPVRRSRRRSRIFPTEETKWSAVVETISDLHRRGRPVLVGTRSVKASEQLSELLNREELPHSVLNARQDQQEAEIIAQAGEPGRITVATNMAGRGTDIKLAPGIAELGGLHVLATERHEAGRIDRQLFGRCGRQGDPGSMEAVVSLEDELVTLHCPKKVIELLTWACSPERPVPRCLGSLVFWFAQFTAEWRHSRTRRDLLKVDEHLANLLAFSGRLE
jgi:preprotein translocase subunit SecA